MTAGPNQPLGSLRGIGAKRILLFEKLGLRSVEDLFWFFPRRYEDRRVITPLQSIREEGTYVVAVSIEGVDRIRTRRPAVFRYTASLSDQEGQARAVWFGGWSMLRGFSFPARVLLYGKARLIDGVPEFTNPEIELWTEGAKGEAWGCVLPVYPLTEGLSGKWLRKFIHAQLKETLPTLPEKLPEKIIKKRRLLPILTAIMGMHRPQSREHWALSRKRLAYEECFAYQLRLEQWRQKVQQSSTVPLISASLSSPVSFFDQLPFTLTSSQRAAIEEIVSDMRGPLPMNRLLQGDVGSGKTIVALSAAFGVLQSGYNAALMAPTTLLASQLYEVAKSIFTPFSLSCRLITSATPASERRKIMEELSLGAPLFIVGTHALYSEGVQLPRLGLVIIDEQHRFGVLQRALFAAKGDYPHVLTMSGTPIPRTLYLALYGELPVSTLTEKPMGRIPVQTRRVSFKQLPRLIDFIRKEIAGGGQVYWVCPLIEGDAQTVLSVEKRFLYLNKTLPDVPVALLHGRMAEEEKDTVLRAFLNKETSLLVATTVVEVGVDVPAATVMVIEGASSFGLAQLHQLRGRVGRGNRRSACFLLDDSTEAIAVERLAVLEKSTDGFYIAEQDLLLRGSGDIAGNRQHGENGFRLVNLISDVRLMEWAREDAREYNHAMNGDRILTKEG